MGKKKKNKGCCMDGYDLAKLTPIVIMLPTPEDNRDRFVSCLSHCVTIDLITKKEMKHYLKLYDLDLIDQWEYEFRGDFKPELVIQLKTIVK